MRFACIHWFTCRHFLIQDAKGPYGQIDNELLITMILNRPIEINSVVDSDKYTSNVVVWTKAPRLLKPLFFGY